MGELAENIGQWLVSPRRIVIDVLFAFFAIILFYNGWLGISCQLGQSGYLQCELVRLLYFSAGIFCSLLLTPAFVEGRLRTTAGRFLKTEPVNQPPSVSDLEGIDPSKYEAIHVTDDSMEFRPNRDE